MKTLLFIISLTIVLQTGAMGVPKCLSIFPPSTSVSIQGDFIPEDAWRQAGLDPSKVTLLVENYPKGTGFDKTPLIDISFFYDGNFMGEIQMYTFEKNKWGIYSELESAFRGKGIGSLVYLMGAEIMFRLYPRVVSLDSWDGTVHANFMWEKLVRNGYAIKSPQDKNEVLVRYYYQLLKSRIGQNIKYYINRVAGDGIPREI